MATEKRKSQVNGSVRALRQSHRDAGERSRERWSHPDDWPLIDGLITRLRKERGTIIDRPIFKKK